VILAFHPELKKPIPVNIIVGVTVSVMGAIILAVVLIFGLPKIFHWWELRKKLSEITEGDSEPGAVEMVPQNTGINAAIEVSQQD